MPELDVQPQQNTSPQLRDYIRVLIERAWIIVLAIVVSVGATVFFSYRATPVYQASTTVVFQTNSLDRTLFGSQVFANTSEPRDVETGASLVKIAPVAEAVKAELGSPRSVHELLKMVIVTPSTTSNVITIDAFSSDPREAADVANSFAAQFTLYRKKTDQAIVAAARELVKAQMDSLSADDAVSEYGVMLKEKYASLQILESMQTGGFHVVQSATPSETPVSPKTVQNGLLALLAGLVLGLGGAFLLNYFDNRIKDVKTLERCYGLPVLASIPTVGRKWKPKERGERSSAAVGFAASPHLLESFRALRSNLQFFDSDGKRINTILITSALPREGKTMTSVNLAISLALSGKRVVLVEADLRRPMVPSYLGLENKIGLSTLLAGRTELADALQLVKLKAFTPEGDPEGHQEANDSRLQRDLYCLSSGPQPPNPAELLGSDRMRQLLLQLNPIMDYVVIDSPPILVVADALTLAPLVDCVIITAQINSTTRDEADEAADVLRRSGGRVIGVVAEGVKAKSSYYGAYAYSRGKAET